MHKLAMFDTIPINLEPEMYQKTSPILGPVNEFDHVHNKNFHNVGLFLLVTNLLITRCVRYYSTINWTEQWFHEMSLRNNKYDIVACIKIGGGLFVVI